MDEDSDESEEESDEEEKVVGLLGKRKAKDADVVTFTSDKKQKVGGGTPAGMEGV